MSDFEDIDVVADQDQVEYDQNEINARAMKKILTHDPQTRDHLDSQSSDMRDFIQNQREILSDLVKDTSIKSDISEFKPNVDIDKWQAENKELIYMSNNQVFSKDIILQQNAYKAEKKLNKLRREMFEEDDTIVTGSYYDKLEKLKNSPLYDCLNHMPKPVVHHIHLTAACPLEFLVKKICYYNHVYFNEKEQNFKVSKNGIKDEGYIQVNKLRQHWKNANDFDNHLKNTMLLKQGTETQEHHEIWKYFQPKFMMTLELYNYDQFFEQILYRVSRNMVNQCITVIEWKHIFGMVFNEDGPLSVEQEVAIFKRVQDLIQQRFPLFQFRIVTCGLKIVGKDHIQTQIDAFFESKKYTDMVVGFDMVNEEDFTPPIDIFLDQIYEAKAKAAKLGIEFPLYLHCGESNNRDNLQLYDAIVLGTKRIGHGFRLAYHPELMKVVKEKEICIECCPISNYVLGYVLDLRNHPARSFLHQGLPVSISSDDPGFMGYEGVTLDYLYAFLAWDLDIADLKKLCLNSIKYSSIKESEKEKLYQFFNYKWNRFLDYVRGAY